MSERIETPVLKKEVDPLKIKGMYSLWLIPLACSLIVNLGLWFKYSEADADAEFFYHHVENDAKRIAGLKRQVAEGDALRDDIEEMTSMGVPPGLDVPPAMAAFHECQRDPVGLRFEAESLGYKQRGVWNSYEYGLFRIHNPEPIRNNWRSVLVTGAACEITDGHLIIADSTPSAYLVKVEGEESYHPHACPNGAYRLVSRRNAVMEYAIRQTCLARAKALEFKTQPAASGP